jgi:hypothetical protein
MLRPSGNFGGDPSHFPRLGIVLFLLCLSISMAAPARAQVNSTSTGVALNANLATSLTVNASPGLVNFTLPPSGTANGSSAISINTSWTLSPSVGAVTTYAYFTSAPAALSDGGGDNIPSSKVTGSVNGGAFGPFTGASPFAAASSITLSSTRILGNNRSSTHADTLALTISTVGLALPAATYTGVLNIQAQAL